ncbi:enoyl-CoA hydratase/isomerase family protein [Curtobacterium ammoniigenes]|uniref:enoyl-CoA hydratase/isomerase family protein n=1 Tax=Curtobacterium ammoniigenes TaxID=395387 RepID=UPI000836C54C|nr:enoyl-CoA hydratase-related protein [Curtobacterium ammoniigenes]
MPDRHVPTAPAADDRELTTLRIEHHADGVAVLRLDRPDRRNAQTVRMFAEFGIAARQLSGSAVRALVITGTGDLAFSAGFDLGEIDVIAAMGVRDFLQFQETATNGIQALRSLPFPVIAAVQGAAVGGGLALALAADIRLVTPSTRLSAAFIRMGLSAGELGTSYQLPRLIGPGVAAEFAYTGRTMDGAEAVRTGLANRMVDDDRLDAEALTLARTIAQRDPAEVRLEKMLLHRAIEVPSFAAILDLERALRLATAGEPA